MSHFHVPYFYYQSTEDCYRSAMSYDYPPPPTHTISSSWSFDQGQNLASSLLSVINYVKYFNRELYPNLLTT